MDEINEWDEIDYLSATMLPNLAKIRILFEHDSESKSFAQFMHRFNGMIIMFILI